MNTHTTDQSPIRIALFDYDDTISRGDSIVPYIRYCIKQGVAPKNQWLHALRALWAYMLPNRGFPNPKETALSFIKGRRVTDMDEVAADFFRDVGRARLIPEAVAEMSALKAQGYTILLVTASSGAYMGALAALSQIDAVISTPALKQDGVYTGKMGTDCREAEKPRRVLAWLAEQGLAERAQIVRAYGNSTHDIPMLQLAEQAVAVSPSRKLKEALPQAAIASWTNK